MPDSYNDRSPTPSASPKPARTGTASPAINASPSKAGATGGGLDNMRAGYTTHEAGSTRAATSPIKRTRAAVASFADATV